MSRYGLSTQACHCAIHALGCLQPQNVPFYAALSHPLGTRGSAGTGRHYRNPWPSRTKHMACIRLFHAMPNQWRDASRMLQIDFPPLTARWQSLERCFFVASPPQMPKLAYQSCTAHAKRERAENDWHRYAASNLGMELRIPGVSNRSSFFPHG